MTTSNEASLGVFERKILRKIFGPLQVVYGEYLRRWNDELYELYDVIDIAQRIKIQRLRWLGNAVRMDTNALALKVFDAVPADGSRGRGRSPMRRKDQEVKDLAFLSVSNWHRLARKKND